MDLGSFTREMKITKSLFYDIIKGEKRERGGDKCKRIFWRAKNQKEWFFKGFVNISDQTISNNL